MADFNQINQFGSAKPTRSGEGMSCAECEAMLVDWMDAIVDGTLSLKDRAAFDLHIATCKECGQMLADAQRGAALLEMLKSPRPQPSPALLDRIIAQTSGLPATAQAADPVAAALGLPAFDGAAANSATLVPAPAAGIAAIPFSVPSNVLPFRARLAGRFNVQAVTRTMMQPRLAMTAAMAFFSIALTMNLTGVHLTELRATDLKPSNIRHTFYQADASLVRYYDNLRVVYELESRVSDLKQSSDSDSPSAKPESKSGAGKERSSPDNDPKHKQTPKSGGGTSQRRFPLQPEFRLADERFERHTDRDLSVAVLDRAVSRGMTNKSKEMLQEGGLV